MKLIVFEGIATSGKTVFAGLLQSYLQNYFQENTDINFSFSYENNSKRPGFGLGALALFRNPQALKKKNLETVHNHLNHVIDELENTEKADKLFDENINYGFILDRLHPTYFDSLNADMSDFLEFENRIRPYTHFIILNFKNFNSDKLYSRMNESLIQRPDHAFTKKHYYTLIGNATSPVEQERILWDHYGKKIASYTKAYNESTLNKTMIWADDLITPQDYKKELTPKFLKTIVDFIES